MTPNSALKAYAVNPFVGPLSPGKLVIRLCDKRRYLGRDANRYNVLPDPVIDVRAGIYLESDSDRATQSKGIELGSIEGTLVRSGRITKEGDNIRQVLPPTEIIIGADSLRKVCDRSGLEVKRMATYLFEDEGGLKKVIQDSYPEFFSGSGDVLFLEKLFLKQLYRGRGIGLLALACLIDVLPSFGDRSVCLFPRPLNGINEFTNQPYEGEALESVSRRIADYFSLLGFRKLTTDERNLPLYGLSTSVVNPKVTDVCPPRPLEGGALERASQWIADFSSLLGFKTLTTDEQNLPLYGSSNSVVNPKIIEVTPHHFVGSSDREKEFGTEEGRRIQDRHYWDPLLTKLLESTPDSPKIIPKRTCIPARKNAFPPGYFYVEIDERSFQLGVGVGISSYPVNAVLGFVGQGSGKIGKLEGRLFLRGRMKNEGRGDVLVIQHLTIESKYRGHGLSLLMIDSLLAILHPHTAILVLDSKADKLKSHFASMGFDSLVHAAPMTGKSYFGLCTADTRPPMSTLVPNAFEWRSLGDFMSLRGDPKDQYGFALEVAPW